MSQGETSYDLVHPHALLRRIRTTLFDYAQHSRRIVEERMGPITCRAGCSHCCRSKILIDAGQGAQIYLALHTEGRWTPALREQLAAEDAAMAPTSHAEWHRLRRPCVFLDARGRCSVYAYRPFACALTFSVTPDPAACAIGGGKSSFQALPDNLKPLIAASEALMTAAGEDEVWLMTIPAAVLYGAAMLEHGPGGERPAVARIEHRYMEGAEELIRRFDEHAVGARP